MTQRDGGPNQGTTGGVTDAGDGTGGSAGTDSAGKPGGASKSDKMIEGVSEAEKNPTVPAGGEIDFHDSGFLAKQFPQVSQTLPHLIDAVRDARKAVNKQNTLYENLARRYDLSVLGLATTSTILAAVVASQALSLYYKPYVSLVLPVTTALTAAVAAWQTSIQTRTRVVSGTRAALELDELLGIIDHAIYRDYENKLYESVPIIDQNMVDQWWSRLRVILRADYEEYIKEWSNRPAVPSRPST